MSQILPFQPLAIPAARIVEKLASRRDRDMQRGRRAARAVRAAGGSAREAALAHVEAALDSAAAAHNRLKLKVERILRLGAWHPEVCARFGRRVALLRGYTISEAIWCVERWYRDERRALQVAAAFGRGSRVSLDLLREMRLMLRLARRKLTDRQFHAIIIAVLAGDSA